MVGLSYGRLIPGMSGTGGSTDKESMLAIEGYLKSGNVRYVYPKEYYYVFQP